MEEEWMDVINTKGYKISNKGRLKSYRRKNPIILKAALDRYGYYYVTIFYSENPIKKKIHQLVAESFLGHRPDGTTKLVVNHKDYNKTNNVISNLEIVTVRENSNRVHLSSKSKYIGVGFRNGKWVARICINGNRVWLGCFVKEYEAHLAYEKALAEHLSTL